MNINMEASQTEFFIHFDTSDQLVQFLKHSKYRIGHKCCSGTGALLLDVKSNADLQHIKSEYLHKHPSH
jgi:hypothetical protein